MYTRNLKIKLRCNINAQKQNNKKTKKQKKLKNLKKHRGN